MEEYTEGNSEEDWIKKIFNVSSLPKHISYEEFKKKGYFVVPSKSDDAPLTVSNRWFYEGRPCDTPDPMNPNLNTSKSHLLATDTGKIEFVSESLKRFDPNDKERPPLPRYIPSWEGYNTKEITKKYPLYLITPHVKFSYHTQTDNKNPWIEDIPVHRIKKNGYSWWPVRNKSSRCCRQGHQ